ncbi:Uncharacterized protein Rs2_48158 [Raphanus sativus]|nr:Uncharacterized protein Rs2_48158 [Raphanus sativus]
MAGKINARELSSSSFTGRTSSAVISATQVWTYYVSNVHPAGLASPIVSVKLRSPEHCEYAHDYFVRGKPELTVEIERQFKEGVLRFKNIKPPEPGSREIRERRMVSYWPRKLPGISLSCKEM